jgi:hypothetical protein
MGPTQIQARPQKEPNNVKNDVAGGKSPDDSFELSDFLSRHFGMESTSARFLHRPHSTRPSQARVSALIPVQSLEDFLISSYKTSELVSITSEDRESGYASGAVLMLFMFRLLASYP